MVGSDTVYRCQCVCAAVRETDGFVTGLPWTVGVQGGLPCAWHLYSYCLRHIAEVADGHVHKSPLIYLYVLHSSKLKLPSVCI